MYTLYPYSRAVNTGVILDTRVHGPCSRVMCTGARNSRAPVHTTRVYGPSTRPVKTGSVYRALLKWRDWWWRGGLTAAVL